MSINAAKRDFSDTPLIVDIYHQQQIPRQGLIRNLLRPLTLN